MFRLPRQRAEQRRRQARAQRVDVLLPFRHGRVDAVGDPAGERQAPRRDGFRGQQGVVQAPQARADHQDHRQVEPRRQVGAVESGAERHAKTADAFHQHETCLGRQLPISGRDAVGVDRPARVRRRQVGGDRRIETIGIDQRPFRRDGTGFDEPLDVFVAAGLVNAVLRNRQRRRAALDAALAAEPVAVHAHPAWLLERLQADWPADWPAIVEASNQQAPMMLRVNLARESRDEALARLATAGIAAAAHAQVASAVVLEHPAEVSALPGFADGRLSVQDGAGQLAAPLLAPEPGDRVLDACCAPGGKTGHLLETALGLELLALDIDATRLVRVRENLDRLGYDAELLAADAGAPADWWDGRPFERILLDAPCSATGVIRRHPDIKALRQPADIDALAARQRALLDALWPLLAPGGILLYATCSLLRAENETVIAAFLAAHPDAAELVIDADWGLALRHGRQILPGSAGLDGFYYARLLRTP